MALTSNITSNTTVVLDSAADESRHYHCGVEGTFDSGTLKFQTRKNGSSNDRDVGNAASFTADGVCIVYVHKNHALTATMSGAGGSVDVNVDVELAPHV